MIWLGFFVAMSIGALVRGIVNDRSFFKAFVPWAWGVVGGIAALAMALLGACHQ